MSSGYVEVVCCGVVCGSSGYVEVVCCGVVCVPVHCVDGKLFGRFFVRHLFL